MSNRSQRQINLFFANLIAKIRKWLIKIGSPFRISRRFVRSLFAQSRGQGKGKRGTQAGFVLPTVVMVTTVVTLLVVLMVARSSERAKTAANARVEQALNLATTPAVDRARAKIAALLSEETLGRGTPSSAKIYTVMETNPKYTFDDEIRLQIVDDINSNGKIKAARDSENQEFTNTAWKYPIDTDNNGKFDSIAIYSIHLLNQPLDSNKLPKRRLSLVDARTPPMDESSLRGDCVTSAGGSEGAGWYVRNGKQAKAMFAYSATVPITSSTLPGISATEFASKYEVSPGINKGFSSLELQYDLIRRPLNNTAVWFEDDLELTRPSTFRLNGRVFTNSNLMVGAADNARPIRFYQVSSPYSCQYSVENGEVLVAGNVVLGDTMYKDFSGIQSVTLDLYNPSATPTAVPPAPTVATFGSGNGTVSNPGKDVGFNNFAFTRRVNVLIEAAKQRADVSADEPIEIVPIGASPITGKPVGQYPKSVQELFFTLLRQGKSDADAETEALRTYFKNRTRKVPFIEVPFKDKDNDSVVLGTYTQTVLNTYLGGSGSVTYDANNGVITITGGIELFPPPAWAIPTYASAPPGFSLGSAVGFPSSTSGINPLAFSNAQMPATSPDTREQNGNKQFELGDRILIGNNLPAQWYNLNEQSKFSDKTVPYTLGTSGINWADVAQSRTTNTRIDALADLGDFGRDGFWELAAAASPTATDDADQYERSCTDNPGTTDIESCNEISPVRGGLRAITGAGIYSRRPTDSFLPPPPKLANENNSKIDVVAGDTFTELNFNKGSIPTDSANNDYGYVVWPDSMPMTGAVKWNSSTSSYQGWYNGALTSTGSDTDYSNPLKASGEPKKGDLQMRATAVYHYKTSVFDPVFAPSTYQRPIACVSSYYDPSDGYTARNGESQPGTALPDVSGLIDSDNDGTLDRLANGQAIPADMALNANNARGRSNNGVTYAVTSGVNKFSSDFTSTNFTYDATTKLFSNTEPNPIGTNNISSLSKRLAYQANLVFPNGRWVNPQLRSGLRKIAASSTLSLAEQSAIDSSLCALQILDRSLTVNSTPTTNVTVPHGAFKESTFLDGREVKALNKDESLPANSDIYDLEIEQRQPLEIRATDIDINKLRTSVVQGNNNRGSTTTKGVPTEYMLPYSGLVYASRDDAQEDLSDTSDNLATRKQLSPTDFKLDPTRRPNAIRLIDGSRLWRGASTTTSQPTWTEDTKGEKGLVLVSNLPVYIKGDFNKHTQQEFTTALDADWNNFYTRNTINNNFACRRGSSTNCAIGDEWRAAVVVADAPTVVSSTSKDGFRTDGDYDLRNNVDTSSKSSEETPLKYLKKGFWNNNFITNTNYLNGNGFPSSTDPSADANLFPGDRRTTYLANGVTPIQRRGGTYEFSMEICRKLPTSECGVNDWTAVDAGTTVMPDSSVTSGARYIAPEDLRFPRRLHFLRSNDVFGDGSRALVLAATCSTSIADQVSYPIPIGVNSSGNTYAYLNTGSACQKAYNSESASAESASASASAISASASASSASVSSASASSASSVGVSRSASSASISSNSSASASSASASSASASSASASSASASSRSASTASASISSASSASRSSASAASSISASISSASSASRSSASAASSISASRSSASSASRSSSSASVVSRSASSASVVSRSASSASSASLSSASAASSVSASNASASVSNASRASLSASSASSASLSSASNASRASLSASSASSASLSSASASASSASRVSLSASSASSASLSTASASTSSASVASASSASASFASASSASASSVSASRVSASASSASVSRSEASKRGIGMLLRAPSFAIAVPRPSIASGGTMPRMPMAAMLPRTNANSIGQIAAQWTPPSDFPLNGSSKEKDSGRLVGDFLGNFASLPANGFGKDAPQRVAKALWFRVVNNPGGSSTFPGDALGDTSKVRYDADEDNYALYTYTANAAFDSTNKTFTTNGLDKKAAPKLLLPDTLNFKVTGGVGEVSTTGTYSLNDSSGTVPSTVPNAASDFAICTQDAQSRLVRALTPANIEGSGDCSAAYKTSINNFLAGLRSIATDTLPTKIFDKTSGITTETITAPSDASVVVVKMPANIATTTDVKLTLQASKPDTMFVLKLPNTTVIGKNFVSDTDSGSGFRLQMDGVSPNNIFWVLGDVATATLEFKSPYKPFANWANSADSANEPAKIHNATHRTVLIGNFIGDGKLVKDANGNSIPNNVEMRNVRFLGLSEKPTLANGKADPDAAKQYDPNAAIVAMTSDSEPLMLPVLQVHAPTTLPSDSGNSTNLAQNGTINGSSSSEWTEIASSAGTEVNAIFVAGNTPSRYGVDFIPSTGGSTVTTAETGGGLSNFIRYIENWYTIAPSRISGGFIQLKRSSYATAPYSATAPYKDLTAFSFTSDINSSDLRSVFGLASGTPGSSGSGIKTQYYASATTQVLPYYYPPARSWGYDVGLLTQPPDLFALKFSNIVPTPNEFFREVGRDDMYVKGLLCALEPAGVTTSTSDDKRNATGASTNTYTEFALPLDQRPLDCFDATNVSKYE